MNLYLNKEHIDDVEQEIRPLMAMAVTVPVDGIRGVVIYVSASPFLGDDVTADDLRRIADGLELKARLPVNAVPLHQFTQSVGINPHRCIECGNTHSLGNHF